MKNVCDFLETLGLSPQSFTICTSRETGSAIEVHTTLTLGSCAINSAEIYYRTEEKKTEKGWQPDSNLDSRIA